jgi:hypothetical protein
MTDLLDPKNDYVFKRLFADSPELLAALVNAVLAPAAPIVVVAVRNPGIDPAELSGKYIVLDLLVEDSEGRQYDIEMQIRRYRAWSARSTYRDVQSRPARHRSRRAGRLDRIVRALERGAYHVPDRRRVRARRAREA